MYKLKRRIPALAVAAAIAAPALAAVDPTIAPYKSASGVSGNITSVGSDTLNNLMTLWAEEFKRQYPNVNIQIQGAGSSTAPPALTEGTANFGPMSRPMKDGEKAAFEAKYGYKPTEIKVALDALAVFVNKDNPVKGLTIPQVDAIFSSTRKCGYERPVARWSDVGLTGDMAGRPFQIFGRNSVSGTYGFFKETALCKGDFDPTVNEQPGSASVVQSVGTSINAIGYSGIGYKTSSVKAVPLARTASGSFIIPNDENAINGSYPLTRYLYVYINKNPNEPLQPNVREYLKMVLSKQGQETVVKDGYIPLPKKVVEQELAKLE